MRRRFSLTARLTLLFAAVSSAVLLGLGLVIANSVERHFVELDEVELGGKLELAGSALRRLDGPAEPAAMRPVLETCFIGHRGLAVAVAGPGGETMFANSAVAFPEAVFAQARSGGAAQPMTWTHDGRPYRGLAMTTSAGRDARTVSVAVATDISHHREFLAGFRRALGLFVGAAAILIGLLAWASVRHGLAPLHAMSERAANVTAEKLDLRVAEDSVPVELQELAASMNRMLARLEESFRRLSEVTSDMAHELRTPLAALMTQTQVALSREREAADYREVLASSAEELERLARTISEMLFIAKAENGLIVPERESVDLGREVQALFEFYEALAAEHGVGLRLTGDRTVEGDRLMLRRALSNLLSNAIRHTPRGGEVSLRIDSKSAGLAEVDVENPGPEIPPESRARIFERFHRLDPARSRDGAGAGLGLAIARSIAVAHGGSISVESSAGRTRFTLRLPMRGRGT